MKKLKTKWLAWAMALVMILGIVQVGTMPIVQAADDNTEVEYEYQMLDQSKMVNATASSYQDPPMYNDGPASQAFDGNSDTGWHTEYNTAPNPYHWIQWGLQETCLIGKLVYIPKTTANNGIWTKVKVEVNTGSEWKEVFNGEMPANNEISFAPVNAAEIKVTIIDSQNADDQKFASAGEINVYQAVPVEPEIDYTVTVTPETYVLNEGDKTTLEEMGLKVNISPEIPEGVESSITWPVMNQNVIQLDEAGNVTAVGTGTARIKVKVKIGDTIYNAGCDVTVNKVEAENVIVLNGTEYRVNSLEEAIEQSGLISAPVGIEVSKIESIEFKSGVVRKEDFDYLKEHQKAIIGKLKTFIIGDDVALRGLGNGQIPMNTLYISPNTTGNLETVYLGQNVKELGQKAFAYHKNMMSFEAPGLETFGGLDRVNSLPALSLPSVKTVTGSLFGTMTNTKTTSVSFPSAEVIQYESFEELKGLTTLELGANPPKVVYNANYESSEKTLKFASGVAENLTLKIPDGALEAYKTDTGYDEATGAWHGIPLAGNAHEHEDMSFATAITEPVFELTEGSYYLDADITAAKTIKISGNVKLCLNGHSYAVYQINVPEGASLTICDCGESGTITAKREKVLNVTGGIVNLESGSIVATPSQQLYGVIYVTSGTININGGKIDGEKSAAIYAIPQGSSSSVEVNVTGGNINRIATDSDSEFKSRGGIIAYNATVVKISGGTVQGVFAGSGTTEVNVISGKIDGSIVNANGDVTISGDAEVINTEDWAIAARGGTTNISGGTITGQIDGIRGYKGDLNISGGTITGIEGSGLYLNDVRYPDDSCYPNMIISGGTIAGKTYGIDLEKFSPTDNYYMLSLTGTPVISGETADILMTKEKQIYGHLDGNPYNGEPLTIAAKGKYYTEKEGAVIVVVKAPIDPASLLDKFVYQTESDFELAAGKDALVLKKHEHVYTYTANENVITESCTCGHSATATITAEDAEYTGEAIETATVAYTENWAGEKPEVVYENNTEVGTAIAKLTIGDVTASVTFAITDTTAPKVTATETLNDDNTVTVTLTANEPLQTPEGWTAGEDGKTFTRVYTANGSETVTVSDLAGNTTEVKVEVTLIDETAPEVEVEQKLNADNTVTATITASEPVKTPEGWTAVVKDGTTFTKVYTENGIDIVKVEDLAGNVVEVKIEITMIDDQKPEVKVEQKYDKKDNTVTVTITTSESVETPKGWKQADEDGKVFTRVYNRNGKYEVVVEDEFGNEAKVSFEVKDIVKKDDGKPGDNNKPDDDKKPNDNKKPDDNKKPTTPATGDDTSFVVWGALLLAALAAVAAVVIRKRTNK